MTGFSPKRRVKALARLSVAEGTEEQLLNDPRVREAYLGVA
jgi:hypothetical protein